MGKLVTFWSPYAGRFGTTASMCAVSAVFGILNPEIEIAVCHFGEENGFFDLTAQGNKELTGKTGVAALKLNYMQSALTSERIRRCAVPLMLKNMSLYPDSKERNELLRNQILREKIVQEFDVTFLDLSSESEDALWFVEKADMAVVVLPQSVRSWDAFFQSKDTFAVSKEVNVILGNYLPDSKYNEAFFTRKKEYREKSRVIGCIPCNAEFMDAMEERKVLDFCLRNEFARKNEEQYAFMEHTRKVACRIAKSIRVGGEKKLFTHGFM